MTLYATKQHDTRRIVSDLCTEDIPVESLSVCLQFLICDDFLIMSRNMPGAYMYVTIASFNIIFNWLFTILPNIRCFVAFGTERAVNTHVNKWHWVTNCLGPFHKFCVQ